MNRNKTITKALNLAGTGLELGPLCWPVVSKEESDIYYVDHATTAELKEKYSKEDVPLDEIVEVDYSLQGKTLLATIGREKKFDYVIASHVIEHIPDIIRWLDDISSILKPGGKLSLVIPDKRYTFDINRQVTKPAGVIGAYIDKYKKPDSSMMFDFASEYVTGIDSKKIWMGELYDTSEVRHRYSLKEAMEMALENKMPETYVDSHCHTFTPYSFFEILKAAAELGLIGFSVEAFDPTENGEYEFFVTLKKVRDSDSKRSILKSIPKLEREPSKRELNARVDSLQQQINNLEGSLSWRITEPLRKMKKLFVNPR